jgi:hypothetical protein
VVQSPKRSRNEVSELASTRDDISEITPELEMEGHASKKIRMGGE